MLRLSSQSRTIFFDRLTVDFIHPMKGKTVNSRVRCPANGSDKHTVCWPRDYPSVSSASPRSLSSAYFASNWKGSRSVPFRADFERESNERYPPRGARSFSTRWRSTQQHDGNLNATRALLPDPKTSSGKTAVALTSDDGGGGGGASCADFSVDLACVFISSWILNRIIRLVSRTYKKPCFSFAPSMISQEEIDVISNVIQWNR